VAAAAVGFAFSPLFNHYNGMQRLPAAAASMLIRVRVR